jgi:hypothetical protein
VVLRLDLLVSGDPIVENKLVERLVCTKLAEVA